MSNFCVSDGGPPFFYNSQNIFDAATQPSTVHVTNTGLARFFQRYLLQKAISVFEWKVPDGWAKNYMLYCLYVWGFVAVLNTDKYGVIPQQCGLGGYDVFYQPREVIVVNPLIRKTLEPVIGVNCTLLRLQPDYGGVFDLVSYYGDQMALTAQSFGVNALNSKLAYLFLANDSKIGQSLRKMYDNYAKGEPAVVVDKRLFDTADGSDNYRFVQVDATQPKTLLDLLATLKQLEIMFDQFVGIPNVSSTRRERELTTELQANQLSTRSLASTWLENLQETVRQTNDMFGLDISVDWRFDDGTGVRDDSGTVPVRPDSV